MVAIGQSNSRLALGVRSIPPWQTTETAPTGRFPASRCGFRSRRRLAHCGRVMTACDTTRTARRPARVRGGIVSGGTGSVCHGDRLGLAGPDPT